jgi:phosphoribosyl-ATP pyrophosphohydrolase
MMAEAHDARVLDELFQVIVSRKGGDPATSRTAKLFARGPKKIAQKLGEEAVETALEGEHGTQADLAAESADLLYHLLVLWAARDVDPRAVWDELLRRRGAQAPKA